MVLLMARRKAGPRAKDAQGGVGKQLWEAKGPTVVRKWHRDSLKRINLLFLKVKRRREMKLLMMKMMIMW
jgi:hypothetical protein